MVCWKMKIHSLSTHHCAERRVKGLSPQNTKSVAAKSNLVEVTGDHIYKHNNKH